MKTSVRYSIQVLADERDRGFIALSPEFPGVSAFGDTRDEALLEVRTALELAIDTYEEEGWPLPEPAAFPELELPSGEFRVRLPRSVHAQLGRRAATEGVSHNQLVVTYVVAGLAGRLWDESIEGQRINPSTRDAVKF